MTVGITHNRDKIRRIFLKGKAKFQQRAQIDVANAVAVALLKATSASAYSVGRVLTTHDPCFGWIPSLFVGAILCASCILWAIIRLFTLMERA